MKTGAKVGLGLGLLAILAMSGAKKTPRESPASKWPPGSRRSPADVARGEAALWEGLVETDAVALPRLKEYWEPTGQAFSTTDIPWSAAFVSWVVANSNQPEALTPSGAHIYYTRAAYHARGEPGRYGAYKPSELPLEPGDIVVRGRKKESPLTWSDISDGSGVFQPTHGDVVTSVTPTSARIVGGNVGNGVREREIALTNGYATDPYVAVLRLQPGRLMA